MSARQVLAALPAALLLAAAPVAADGVYKWVDSNGQTHFASSPPTGKTVNKLNIPATASGPASSTGGKDWQEQLQLSNQRRQLAREKEQDAAKGKSENEQRCLSAQRALDTLNRERPIYRVNSQGEREYMDDGQRQSSQEAVNQRIATYCRN
jgi:hypothetical protein